ncbi:MAG: hypothetical protein R3C05_11775 [Pirellulaceae bacterium]
MNRNSPSEPAVTLARQSTRWSQADSAGGYTMRYLTAMRNYLIELWDDGEAVDNALVLLINHLAAKGFGSSEKGRLRDYLLRSARSAAAAQYKREPTPTPPPVDAMKIDSPDWIRNWQECLLARVWRSMERFSHANPNNWEYHLLRGSDDHPGDTASMLAVRLSNEFGTAIKPEQVKTGLVAARRRFAQLLADEVTDTLESPTPQDVNAELQAIGLLHLVEPFLNAA